MFSRGKMWSRRLLLLLAVSPTLAFSAAGQVSLLSWNILAPQWATPAKYPWAKAAGDLAWPAREKRIVQQIADADADVVCLQECSVEHWSGLYAALQREGYDGVLQEVKAGHPYTNAVLLKRGQLELVRSESRSRALITVLRACSAPAAPPLYLANVHLEAGGGKEEAATRLFQVRSLLRRIELQCEADEARADASSSPRPVPLVIAGDLNCDRSSGLHELLVSGRLAPEHPAAASEAAAEAAPPEMAGYTHPLLPLVDAYASTPPPWGPPLRSSQRSGRLLDFIFVSSPAVSVLRTRPVAKEAGSTRPHQLPHRAQPSDHLPIGALLSWEGAPASWDGGHRPAWQQLYVQNVAER